MTTTEELWKIIVEGRNGILATINADGLPQLSNVYLRPERSSGLIRISTTTVRAKGRNLQRDPRAALHVAGRDFFNFAVAEGPVTLAIPRAPDDTAIEELYELHTALGAATDRSRFGEEMIANHRMVVRLAVKRLYGQILHR